MSRLNELHEMKRAIETEIEREMVALQSVAEIRDQVQELLATTRTNVVQVLCAVSEAYDVPIDVIQSKDRRHAVLTARHVACWLLRDQGMTFTEIGSTFGQDHTTVMSAVTRVNSTPRLRAEAAEIRAGLPGRRLLPTTQASTRPTTQEVA